MTGSLTGRVSLVTGAGKGLGRAYALWLSAQGSAVVVNNRSHASVPSSAQAVVEEILARGGSAVADGHSVEDEAGAGAMVARAISAFGRLDVLVCNAAIVPRATFLAVSVAELRQVVDVNLLGVLLPLHAAWRQMMSTGYGRIVLISSSVGLYGEKDLATYGATKAAMIGLARALSKEVPPEVDIKINVVVPFAYTPAAAVSPRMDGLADKLSPDKVAPVVGWLASEACQHTGLVLHVGGGRATRARILETAPVDIEVVCSDAWLLALSGPALSDEASSGHKAGGRITRR